MHDEHVLYNQLQLGLVVHLVEELLQLTLDERSLLLRKQARNLEDTSFNELHQIFTFIVVVVNGEKFNENLGEDSAVLVDFAFSYDKL